MDNKKYTAVIITISDSVSKGKREDISGKVIADILSQGGFNVLSMVTVSDDLPQITNALLHATDKLSAQLLLTTGGTGFSKRDNTPEATKSVIQREAQAISQAILHYSLQITPRAMLSRAVSGIRNDSLIINLPGSPKAVKESLDYILDSVKHGIDILQGTSTDCARKD